jgi:hypothetical protein
MNLSDLFEEILVNPLEHERLCLGTDVVVNQQARKRWSVDQDDSGIDLFGVALGVRTEPACRDEHPAVGLCTVKGSDEALDIRTPYSPLSSVALGLHVDAVQTQLACLITPSSPSSPDRPRCSAEPAAPA